MKARLCALVVCASVIAVIAQSVDGKWSGEVQGGRGPQQVNLTLKADGGKLTGSVMGRGGEIPIQEGTIAGTALKFKTQQQGRRWNPGHAQLERHAQGRRDRDVAEGRRRRGPGAGIHAEAREITARIVEAGLETRLYCLETRLYFSSGTFVAGASLDCRRTRRCS